jgi:CBS domain containing-hemolysin-like protein
MSEQTPTDPAAAAETAQDAARRAEAAAATARKDRDDAFVLAESAREAAVEAARKAGRFSREFLVTVISVVTTAFGVVVALAWNTALTKWLERYQKAETVALFIYALLITFLAVLAIVILSRVAKRLGASPVEFKIEGKKE